MIGKRLPSQNAPDDRSLESQAPSSRPGLGRAFRGKFLRGCLATILFVVVFYATTRASKLNLHRPLSYWGDALEMSSYLGRDYVFNDLRERFFAPFGVEHASAVRYVLNFLFQPNSTLFLITYSVTRDIVAALNLYYLATFPLIFCTAYWVYGRLKLSNPFRFGSASLYALMPFHFQRNVGHLMESSYFLVPVLAYVVMLALTARPYFHVYINGAWHLYWKEKRDWIFLGVAIFLSSINEYHQLFFMMLLPIGALAGSIRHRNPRILAGAAILLAGAAVAVVARTLLSALLNEPGLGLSIIGAPISAYGGAEQFGLKMIQVILPVIGHRLDYFRHITGVYNEAHAINENSAVALGLYGAIGFVYLVVHGAFAIIKRRSNVTILDLCALLTLCCVLIATIGGISSVVATASALLLGPESILTQVRSYNRIIVFIAFFSYYACSVLVMRFVVRVSSRAKGRWPRKAAVGIVWLPIFILTLWDQVPFKLTNSKDGALRYASDKNFFAGIEAQLAPRSLIFQYPFNIHHFNVSGPPSYPYNYADGIRPYLNSRTLRFTYGGDRGSAQIAWLEATCALPPQRMIQRLCESGFSGIVVHRKLFATPAAAQEFEAQLTALTLPLQESADQDFSFAPLDGFCAAKGITKLELAAGPIKSDARTLRETINFAERPYPEFLVEVSGVSGRESWGRWTIGPVAKLRFGHALPKTFTLDITANAFGPNTGAPVKIRVGSAEKTFVIARNTGDTYRLVFATNGTADTLEIFPPKPMSPKELNPQSGDGREIGIALISIAISH
jgi:phosphoglycerol transferase